MKLKYIALIGSGTTLEIYDSYIVGFMLPIINQLFFPKNLYPELTGVISFSILFIVRPIGAFFWGILGDKHGRSLVFKHAILFMAIATIGIGLLPTFNEVGILAPLLFLFLRVIQGISISGEFGSAVVLCYQQSQVPHKFNNNGKLYFFIFAGILIANAITSFIEFTEIPKNIAWRIPFLVGGLAGIILYQVRKKVQFTEIKNPHINLKSVFKNYKLLAIATCAIFLINLNWLYFSSIGIILTNILSINAISKLSIFCCLIVMVSSIIFGKYITHKIKNKVLVNLCCLILLMYISTILLLNFFNSTSAMIFFYCFETLIAGIVFTSLPVLILDRIPFSLHNSIYNIANNVSTALVVGIIPILIVYLTQKNNNLGLTYILIINLAISLISLLSIKFLYSKPDHIVKK